MKIYKLLLLIFIILVFYFANSGQHEKPKTPAHIKYENWYLETEAKARASITNDYIPALTLSITSDNDPNNYKEIILNSENISDPKDKILRLLSLINEAGLYEYLTDKPEISLGDILIKIQQPEKNLILKFKKIDIASNIKANLFLKLYDEYSKDRITEKTNNKNEVSKITELKDSIFSMFEEQAKQNKQNEN